MMPCDELWLIKLGVPCPSDMAARISPEKKTHIPDYSGNQSDAQCFKTTQKVSLSELHYFFKKNLW